MILIKSMKNRIEELEAFKVLGHKMKMSQAEKNSQELWKSFITKLKFHGLFNGQDMYSIEIYNKNYFSDFNPLNKYEKWAAVKFENIRNLPKDMEILSIPKGKYMVFDYKGNSTEAFKVYQYIYTEWLPKSPFILDSRPHFALMGEKYKNNDPSSEEEIWIPVIDKSTQ